MFKYPEATTNTLNEAAVWLEFAKSITTGEGGGSPAAHVASMADRLTEEFFQRFEVKEGE